MGSLVRRTLHQETKPLDTNATQGPGDLGGGVEPTIEWARFPRVACETFGGQVRERRHFRFDDGGRTAAGYRGKAGDCVVRAIAIATERPYQQIYDLVNRAATRERTGKRKRGVSNARTGVYKSSIHRVMEALGWEWTPTMQIGSGCTVHLRADELPAGRLVVSVSKHLTAVIDGVIYDTHDCSRRGTRCVYGYWTEGARARTMRREEHFAAADGLGERARAEELRLQARKETAGPRRVVRRVPREKEKPRQRSFWEWLFG